MNDQNNVNNNGVNNGDVQEKSWFKRTGDAAYDKWQRFKTSKVGRWTGRLLRLGVLAGVAKACGYPYTVSVENFDALDQELEAAKSRNELSLIEVCCAIGARADLGRPTTTAKENKESFMKYLSQGDK